jgi:hypothetical protein
MDMRARFLAALLIFPASVALAAATANLGVQVVPSGVTACKIGFPYNGTAPAAAVRAGFTTCAANYDFSQTLPANWLSCSPWDGNAHWWYQGQWWYTSEPPCNIAQATDGGNTVLRLIWQAGYLANGGSGSQNALTMSTMNHDTTRVTDFPNGYYEITYRYTPVALRSYTSFWTWTQAAAQGGGGPIEWDFVETYGQGAGVTGAFHPWAHNGDGNYIYQNPAGFDGTQYTIYAGRITSNGTNSIAISSYVGQENVAGGVPAYIASASVPNVQAVDLNKRNHIIVQNGVVPWETVDTPVNVTMYIKSIRVWSCLNWETTMCNGATLTTAP